MKRLSRSVALSVALSALVPSLCCSAPSPQLPAQLQPARPYTRNVAIVVYDGVEVLDFSGPAEVFADAAHHGSQGGEPAFRLFTVAPTSAPITSQGFLKVHPDYTIDNSPRIDILVIPGGSSGTLSSDPRIVARMRTLSEQAELTLTVCSGAFVLARTGLLDGRDATTFYAAVDALQKAAPQVRVQPGRRFIDSGRYVTTAGVSAGIDGSLHVVARLLGQRVAEQTARNMEYRWTPEPYLTAGYHFLNPSATERGRLFQQAELELEERRFAAAEQLYKQVLEQAPQDADAWFGLGGLYMATRDYTHAAQAYQKAAGSEPRRRAALYNLACAHAQKRDRAAALDALTQAVSAGMEDRGHIAHDPDLESLHGDPRFQQLIAGQ